MLRVRRSNRAKDRIRMSLSLVFTWFFKIVGVTAGGWGNQERIAES